MGAHGQTHVAPYTPSIYLFSIRAVVVVVVVIVVEVVEVVSSSSSRSSSSMPSKLIAEQISTLQ